MGEPVRDTSGVTTRVVVLYVREHGGDEAMRAMLEHAGETRSVEELLDEHGWSTYQQKIRLFRAAAEVLGDPGAVRKIGRFMLRSRIALPLLVLLRALGSPEQVLRNVAKANSRFSTNSTVRALEIGNERVTGGLRESALARAIVQLGQAMGLATVAEGIETAEQADVLRDLGCRYGQGYFFAKPMTSRTLRRLLEQPQHVGHDRPLSASESPL